MSLYSDIILDHYRYPRNTGSLPYPTHHAKARNPTCGDEIEMDIEVKNDKIKAVRFRGVGCAISQASASLLTEKVTGRKVDEARSFELAAALALLGVTLSPGRIKCGLLALETLKKAFFVK